MAHEIRWLVENRIILLQVIGETSIEELFERDAKLLNMLDSLPELSVHVLIDAGQSVGTPAFQNYRKLEFTQHPALGWLIINGQFNRLIQFFGKIIGQMIGTRFQLCNDWTEVSRFLADIDPTLPDLLEILEAHGQNSAA